LFPFRATTGKAEKRQALTPRQLASGHFAYATAEDLRPWRNRAGHFAILQKQRFMALGQSEKLAGHSEPLVRELLAETAPGN